MNIQWVSSKLQFPPPIYPLARLGSISWYHPAKQRHPTPGQRQVPTEHTTECHELQEAHGALSHMPGHTSSLAAMLLLILATRRSNPVTESL